MVDLKRSSKILGSAFALGVLAFTSSALPSHAGTNGQQLRITTAETATSITITGKNQAGNTVTWSGRGPGGQRPMVNTTISASNWWWVGPVVITVNRVQGSQVRCSNFSVPRVQTNSDWYSVNCGAATLVR